MPFSDRLTHLWLKDPGLETVWDALEAAGGQARVVGGAVRNALLGRRVEDIDLACDLQPGQTMEALEKAGIKVVPTGIVFGTVTAIVDHKGYEITTLRRDVETDGRRAKVAFTDDWQADASRRDFTLNALYVDREGRLTDYGSGLEDLAARRLRFIGDPQARIQEDVLRLLRFFRFLSQIEGLSPDQPSLAACKAMVHLLPTLSAERVWRELSRLLLGEKAIPVLRLMKKEGILDGFLLEASRIETLENLISFEKEYAQQDAVRRLGVLLERDHAVVARRLKFSKANEARLSFLGALPEAVRACAEKKQLRQCLYDYGKEKMMDAALLAMSEGKLLFASFLPAIRSWIRPVFPLRGRDLLMLGVLEGPEIGARLSALEAWWREKDFLPSRAECLIELEKREV